jgi:type I restriction enzyme S subunit
MHVGTLIPHFKKGDFDKLKIPLPSREDQIAAGDVYLRLSQKIELNRRMNETLDAMAQTIFRDWFVDLGPTRRKFAGITNSVKIMGGLTPDPTRAAELAALFPDALGDNGLPVGWIKEPLLDLADWINGAAYKNMHFSEEPDALPVVKIAELKAGVTGTTKRTNTVSVYLTKQASRPIFMGDSQGTSHETRSYQSDL